MAIIALDRLIHRLYQYYQISTTFLYVALIARWIILFPLVSSKFLPGGIHEFLIYLLGISSIVEMLWQFYFHGVIRSLKSRTVLKDMNFIYLVRVIHFYDDYEHAVILKNTSYSSFILALGFTQAYSHFNKIFKGNKVSKRSWFWKINAFIMLPTLYLSEFYLLLLNLNNYNYHSTLLLDKINYLVLIVFLPLSCLLYKGEFTSSSMQRV
ncbi:hypothetical protein TPHA_0E02490 [Tetrapisispora phaffii CBS 4417]|uniref:Very-long-chain (3R)-3-hydroxyacyl-CoA dehydratase n=1 Tax=Tetrapisispora phaffii (strain ATCC 24235 / CBS 4417 / NBRC 1672 / NRRL Y-8282 / UCD 70-5) TaxID=1071381 RepID=G8BTW3_TETPH|nr:hypothetical protein TPHA_0E02490 [Tetrapisispora phaffii CBS 4417]CCE63341.1 hypothetical protein TPHA_0E02490 [Tetrapisispora phaffii CBS 4417]